jgi:hypothetical protein
MCWIRSNYRTKEAASNPIKQRTPHLSKYQAYTMLSSKVIVKCSLRKAKIRFVILSGRLDVFVSVCKSNISQHLS